MTTAFNVTATIPASPKEIYDAWLSSGGHAAMTGSPARVSAKIGGKFSAWDGYIAGKNLKLVPDERIVQLWRTTQFAEGDADSEIDIQLEKSARGTKLTLRHTNIPDGQPDYRSGWKDCYFTPMTQYFKRKPERPSR
jgi:activator of HSP90 ATPase